ncbi:MAG: hypothetical protein WC055_00965 [Melioribacteraceae bacterium]
MNEYPPEKYSEIDIIDFCLNYFSRHSGCNMVESNYSFKEIESVFDKWVQ